MNALRSYIHNFLYPFYLSIKKVINYTKDDSPLIKIYIHTNRIIENYLYFKTTIQNCIEKEQSVPNIEIFPVLKSNAYGHGIVGISKILRDTRNINTELIPKYFIVDSYFEGRQLVKSSRDNYKIIVIGYTEIEKILKNSEERIVFTITNYNDFATLIDSVKYNNTKKIKSLNLNIKFDVGMNRQGIRHDEIGLFIDKLNSLKQKESCIKILSICTHLPISDISKDTAKIYIERWIKIVDKIDEKLNTGYLIKYRHIFSSLSSENIIDHNLSLLPIKYSNAVRLGIGLYMGHNLKNQALEVKTKISFIKKIKKGETIGYDESFIANKDMKIGSIPVGYYECLDRRLSNKGFVYMEKDGIKHFLPILGKVSMNITTIDLSDMKNINNGDEIVVISKNPDDKNNINSISKLCECIPYEVLIHIPQHLKRIDI